MPQSAEKVLDHAPLFREPEYQEMFARKKAMFECGVPDAKVAEQAELTKTWEYREKNLAREALVVNPAKACQPLGAVFASAGFEKTMSFVHGSQGCVAYYRSHLSRHFKEPCSAVSSSMTEDAAVFGGLNNMVDGLANTYSLYAPKMIAVSTTCMAEVIGDDLHSFIQTAKDKGSVPKEFDVPFAHTPAFVGSHVDGYDVAIKGILEHFWKGDERTPNGKINIIPGFDGFCVGNNRELKRLLDMMGVEYTILSDASDQFDTPSDGEFRMYDGGTKIDDVKAAVNAKATVSLQHWNTRKTLEYAADRRPGDRVVPLSDGRARDRRAADENLGALGQGDSRIDPSRARPPDRRDGRQPGPSARQEIRDLRRPGFRHGDGPLRHGDRRRADPLPRDQRQEGVGGRAAPILAASPFGKDAKIWAGKDLWHLRSLLFTEPVDMLIGSSYGKYLERDTGTPLLRLTFPIFDRHHHHRFPLWGYQGGLRVLTAILDKVFDKLDADTIIPGKTDYSYDLTR